VKIPRHSLNFLKIRVKKVFFLLFFVEEIDKNEAFPAFFVRFPVSSFFGKTDGFVLLFSEKIVPLPPTGRPAATKAETGTLTGVVGCPFCVFAGRPLGFSFGEYRYRTAVATATAREGNNAVGEGIERVVAAHTYVLTGIVYRTALANNDVAGHAVLAAPNLNT
jgi:hypothetical protein